MNLIWQKDDSLHEYRINRHLFVDKDSGKQFAFVWRLRIPKEFPLHDVWKTQMLVEKGGFGRSQKTENPPLIGNHAQIDQAKKMAEETLAKEFGVKNDPPPERTPFLT